MPSPIKIQTLTPNLFRIREVAFAVRQWAESMVEAHDVYFWSSGLGGLCGLCSYVLYKKSKQAQISCEIADGYAHVFVVCDEHIVDVTATQFGSFEEIEIRPLEMHHGHAFWTVKSRRSCKPSAMASYAKTIYGSLPEEVVNDVRSFVRRKTG